jgi:DnaJ family protein A protein 5
LVLFIQHRDPRYKAYQAEAKIKAKADRALERDRQTSKLAAKELAERQAREHAMAASKYNEQDWQRFGVEDSDESGDESHIPQDGEAFECVACSKTFLSEASWANHERSKKHKQATWR